MKIVLVLLMTFLASGNLMAQTYTHPTVGVQNTYIGSCPTATCSGTYYDNGGSGGNYAANINNILRTFCPNTAGMCVRATFTSFSMNDTYFLCFGPNSCCDYLQILNGPMQNSSSLYSNCTNSPGTITSTDPSGCLTFRHVTDGSVQLAGWAATLSCVACGSGPLAGTNADAADATPICSNQALNDASSGPGIVAEGCAGCNIAEKYSNWYRIQVQSGGTLAFTVDPNFNTDDFDPVVYGPNVTPGALGTPIRCSFAQAAGDGNTGLGNGAVDASEDIAGDQWVSALNVTAGQSYYLLINGSSSSSGSNGFSLNWTGTAGLDCSVLPVEILSFTGSYKEGMIDLQWSVAEEKDILYYVLEKMASQGWTDIVQFKANGNFSSYLFTDAKPEKESNLYRVRIVDKDAKAEYSKIIEVSGEESYHFSIYPNPVENFLKVELVDKKGGGFPLILMDGFGRTLMEIPLDHTSKEAIQRTLPLQNLGKGMYYLNYGGDTKIFIKN